MVSEGSNAAAPASSARGALADLPFKAFRALNRLLSSALKLRLIREADLYPWQIARPADRSFVADTLPADARAYLRSDNPRLRALTEDYRNFDERATTPAVWVDGKLVDSDLLYFRGQNPFTAQVGLQFADFRYVLCYYALKCSSAGDLLAKFDEDGLFGVSTFQVDGRLVSRDVLDSAREVDFIRTHVGFEPPQTNILDIGAGYGRLVHRLNQSGSKQVTAFATDAFPASTFISEYYLRFRGMKDAVVPLTGVESFLAEKPVQLAVNVHSFSECRLEAIDWWVSRLANNRVKYLLVIPNFRDEVTGVCLTNAGENMEIIFERYGYVPHVREPRFTDPAVMRNGIDPSYLNLFRLAE